MPLESPPFKKNKKTDSDEEDDITVEKAKEKTDKQVKAYEYNLEQSRNIFFIILYYTYDNNKNVVKYII